MAEDALALFLIPFLKNISLFPATAGSAFKELLMKPNQKSRHLAAASDAIPNRLAMSIPDFCRATTLGRTTVYQLIASEKLKATKVGNRTLLLAADVQAFLETLAAQGGAR